MILCWSINLMLQKFCFFFDLTVLIHACYGKRTVVPACDVHLGCEHPIISTSYTTKHHPGLLAWILLCVPEKFLLSHTVSSLPLFPASRTRWNNAWPFSGSNFYWFWLESFFLVSKAFTIIGVSAAWEGQLRAGTLLNPSISCAFVL